MRGYFGIGIYHPKTVENIGTLWRSAHNFGASFIFTVGHRYRTQPADTTKAWKSVPLYEYAKLDELPIPKECLLVAIEQADGSAVMPSAIHPEGNYILYSLDSCKGVKYH